MPSPFILISVFPFCSFFGLSISYVLTTLVVYLLHFWFFWRPLVEDDLCRVEMATSGRNIGLRSSSFSLLRPGNGWLSHLSMSVVSHDARRRHSRSIILHHHLSFIFLILVRCRLSVLPSVNVHVTCLTTSLAFVWFQQLRFVVSQPASSLTG